MFFTDCQARNLKPKTVSFYRQQLGPFVAFCAEHGVGDVGGVTAPLIRLYIVGLQGRGLSESSVHAGARSVRAWFNFLEFEDVLPGKNPVRRVRMPRRDRRILPALSLSEVQALLSACDAMVCGDRGHGRHVVDRPTATRDRAVLLLLVDTGLRASEVCGLRWWDVDLARGVLWVRAGKGGRDRVGFIGARCRAALTAWRAESPAASDADHVFQNAATRHGAGALTYNGLKLLLRRLGAAAGVPGVHAHALRRTFAVELLRSGCDTWRVARLLGHGDLQSVQQYLPLLQDDLAAAHRAGSPGDRLE